MAGFSFAHDEACDLGDDCSCGARADLELVLEALDSHEYWQLSDLRYRNSGYVLGPGSDDPEKAAEIVRVRALVEKLEAFR